jgi:integrase
MPKLTKRVVDAASDSFTWDSELKGFGLRRSPSGTKSFVVQYRTGGRGSQARRRKIGDTSKLTPEEARTEARRWLADVARGVDPAATRDARDKGVTISELCDLWVAEFPFEKPDKKPSSWATDRSNIERHIKPLLGRKRASSLEKKDVAKFQMDVAAGKSRTDVRTRKQGRAIVTGGRGTAARSLAVLSAILSFAVKRRIVTENPTRGVPPLELKTREKFLTDPEVARLASAITDMQAEGVLSRTAATAIRLLILTGCRKNEILSALWEWVDERGYLRMPDSKTGAKVVPLASAALELLATLPRRSPYVLPAAKGKGHYVGLQKDWERVRTRAGLPQVRIHDLRHSFASAAVQGGASLFLVGKVLGHKQSRTTEIYAHAGDDPRRAVAERTAERLSEAMRGGS